MGGIEIFGQVFYRGIRDASNRLLREIKIMHSLLDQSRTGSTNTTKGGRVMV